LSLEGLEFHHIGWACTSIEREAAPLKELGYQSEGGPFLDETQGVRGQFYVNGGPRLELLEPLEGSGTLAPWLSSGVKMYHLAYVTDDIDASLDGLRAQRGRVTVQPIAAQAFGGRLIAFVMMPNMTLIELINRN